MNKPILFVTLLLAGLLSLYYAESGAIGKVKKFISTDSNYNVTMGMLMKNRPKGLKNPSEYVLEDGFLYEGSMYRLNGKNILLKTDKKIKDLEGKPLVLFYKLKIDLNKILEKKDKAPTDYGKQESMQQLRSDWVAEETGFSIGRSTKQRLKSIKYYEVYDFIYYSGIELKARKDGVFAQFTNDFDKQVTDLKIVGHFEKMQGKPSPFYITKRVGAIEPGSKIEKQFEYTVEKNSKLKNGFSFSLRSIIFEGKVRNYPFSVEMHY